MDTLKWYFELVDHMSGPAKVINSALGEVEKRLKSLDKLANRAGSGIKSALGKAFSVKGAQAIGQGFSGALSLIEDMAAPLQRVAGIGLAVAGAVAGIAVSFGGAVLEAMEFRDTTIAAFSVMYGSQEAAARHFARAQQLALVTPFDTRQVINAYRQITASGFRESEIEGTFALVSDMASASGDMATGLNRAVLAISQIRSRGKLVGGELNQLTELGFGRAVLAPFIASRMGIRAQGEEAVRQVTRAISAGRVSSEVAIGAVMDVLRQRGSGALGGLTRAMGTSLAGQVSNIKDSFFNLIASLDIEKTPGLKAIKDFLTQIAEALNPTSANAQRLQGVFIALANDLGGFLGTMNARQMSQFITELITGINQAVPVVKGLFKIFRSFFGPFAAGFAQPMWALVRAFAMLGNNRAFVFVMQSAGLAMGILLALLMGAAGIITNVVVGAFGALFSAIVALMLGIVTSIQDFGLVLDQLRVWWRQISTWFAGLVVEFGIIGRNIINGLVNGINSGLETAKTAITNVGRTIRNRVTNFFGIASPSRLMFELGGYVSEGFALGISAGASDTTTATEQLTTVPTPRVKAISNTGNVTLQITVNAGAGANGDEIAQALARILPSALANALTSTLEPQVS